MVFLFMIFCGFIVIHAAIVGEQNKNIILPCSFKPNGDEVIHWTTREKKKVHSYYRKKDQLQNQDKDYSGRTSLFLNQISKGNASLLIRGLKKSDETTYACYVGTKAGTMEEEITLQVIAAILGEHNKSIILPCSFQPNGNEVIHWTTREKKNVHSYYNTKDQRQNQDKDYSGRTSLFLNQISNGNASLQIKDLKKSDENTYTCYVGTIAGSTEDEITLQVIDLHHTMEYNWDDSGLLNLTCSVNGSSSEDITVKWYENGHHVKDDQSTKSSYTVLNSSLEYQCTVKHSILQSRWTGTWTMKEPIIKKNDNITCGCNFCQATNTHFYFKWYLRQGTNEVTIASMNNSLPIVSADYKNRVDNYEEHNLNLAKLSANDNGTYICLIETEQEMNIEMTSVNITVQEETHRNRWLICPAVILVFVGGVLFTCKNKRVVHNSEA